jgi:hypothetical protein
VSASRVVYITDLEGRWDKLEQALHGCSWAWLDGGDIRVHPDAVLVYGGDTIDRGPASVRMVRALVRAAQEKPDRVVLLAGNRDINKLRLPRELGPHPPDGAPGPLPDRLRWILARTMGAGQAFAHRAAELGEEDDAVVRSFLDDVAPPDGPLLTYLRLARLGWRWRDVLFLHGAVTEDNLGVVPGAPPSDSVDQWLVALNAFLANQIRSYIQDPTGADHRPLVRYQAPVPGTRANPGSVVYGRPVDASGNPLLPPATLRRRLMSEGVRRVVVGHTPTGDTPSFVHEDGFTLFLGDTSYSPLERGARIELGPEDAVIVGAALVDGVPGPVEVRIERDIPPPLGRYVDGWLIKARLGDAWLGFQMGDGFSPRQHRRP